MRKSTVLWIVAIAITLVSAVYQRITGPTHPIRGMVVLGGEQITYRLERSHEIGSDQVVGFTVPDPWVNGELSWRRYPTNDPYQKVPFTRNDDSLTAALPKQPPAGKLEFQVRLTRGEERVLVPAQPAVTRFRGPVSPYVLIPHVLAMFLGMLWATRAGLAAVSKEPTRVLAFITLALLVLGGFVFGPVMQHRAFGAWWTGIPFGFDLTDNKTLIAVVAWIVAAVRMRGGRDARVAVGMAALVTLVVFAIPHSTWGSQINWDQPPR